MFVLSLTLPTCAGLFSHPKSQEKKTLKNTQAPRPLAYASRFKQDYACHVHCTRSCYVCLRLFERPGSPTSLNKHGSSYLHAQVDSHTQNQKKKKTLKKTCRHHGRLLAHPVSSKNTLVMYIAHEDIMFVCVCLNARALRIL